MISDFDQDRKIESSKGIRSRSFSRVAVGMGICENSHGETHRFPYGRGMTLRLWEIPHVGICGIM